MLRKVNFLMNRGVIALFAVLFAFVLISNTSYAQEKKCEKCAQCEKAQSGQCDKPCCAGCPGMAKVGEQMALAIAPAAAAAPAAAIQVKQSRHLTVLVFSKTAGFRHDVIPQGIVEITKLGLANDFDVDATEDSNLFTDENLQKYDVIIFLNTTGDIFNAEQEAAFQRYIRQGKGWVGIHAASDTEYDWAWYAGLMGGAHFKSHPKQQKATVLVEDFNHASTNHLPYNWELWDEWYNFRQNPREKVRVLAALDEKSYDAGEGAMGDHPIVWCTIYDKGRIFYTGLGHRVDVFKNPLYQRHLLGGIRWAAGLEE